MADANIATNLGSKKRRRGRRASPPGLARLKARVGTEKVERARAVGLRRQGRAPASDDRRFGRGLPAGSVPRPVAPKVDVPGRLGRLRARPTTSVKPVSSATPATAPAPSTTSVKPPKPSVPAGQPKAYGARRKFGSNLPPGLAKRTGSTSTSSTSATPTGFKPPKPPKSPRARGRKSF